MVTELRVPDIGSDGFVDVIEVMVSAGDEIQLNDSVVTLESDKASMEVPADVAGKIATIHVKVGDKVKTGDLLISLEGEASRPAATVNGAAKSEITPPPVAPVVAAPAPTAQTIQAPVGSSDGVYAGPSVRRLARELGIEISKIRGSGPKNRIMKDDLTAYIKQQMSSGGGGFGFPPLPEVDYSQFGTIETKPLNKIKKLTGQFTHRSWVSIPHVTNFDDLFQTAHPNGYPRPL